jgi:hypothetical protein
MESAMAEARKARAVSFNHVALEETLAFYGRLFDCKLRGKSGTSAFTLGDVWVQVALNDEQAANLLIERTVATRNPFDAKYSKVEDADWETCSLVLEPRAVKEQLSRGW